MQKNNPKKKVLIVGGHAGSTALATIEALNNITDCEIFFIGGHSSIEGKNSRTLAQLAFSEMGIKTLTLKTGRVQTKLSRQSIPSLFKIPAGFINAYFLVKKVSPDVVLSFGGYVAPPVVFASWLAKIPIIIHEQTSVIGRANKFSIPFASKIALARTNSQKYYPTDKSEVIGNPIPSGVLKTKRNKIHKPPHILVTGGASGSVAINTLVENILSTLLENFEVTHQTGDIDYNKFCEFKKNLSLQQRARYRVFSVIKPNHWEKYMDWADIFIARSGANFTYQLLVIGKPAILIPLPFTYLDEQKLNAAYAKEFGAAVVLDQLYTTPKELLSAVVEIWNNWDIIVGRLKDKVSPDLFSSEKLANIVCQYLKASNK